MTDPRPRLADDGDGTATVVGVRCVDCGYPVAFDRPGCPVCGGDVVEHRFGPAGTVWSATTVRIPVGERKPPYGLVYVDLDDGPRILATATDPPPLGSRVRLVGTSPDGDPLVAT